MLDIAVRMAGDLAIRLSVDGEVFALGEDYVDGVARYLRDPEAYEGLPPRRRPRGGGAGRGRSRVLGAAAAGGGSIPPSGVSLR